MAKKVDGFLSEDGTFFEHEPECQRYEFVMQLRSLCETHSVNAQNFFVMLNEWNQQIKGYYHADSLCVEKRAEATGRVGFSEEAAGALPQAEDDHENIAIGVTDDESVLQLAVGKRIRMSDIRDGSQSEAVRAARAGTGS